jgi:hypothetical protein
MKTICNLNFIVKTHLLLGILIFLIFVLISIPSQATKYYISPSGNDNNTGTFSFPLFTLNKAWTKVIAGDTVYMRGGTYLYNSWQFLETKSGAAGNLIKIWAYPGETPIFTKGSSWSSDCWVGVFLRNVNYIHIKGIEITGFTQLATGVYSGLRCENVNNCILELLNVHDNGQGIEVTGNSAENLVLNCDAHHNQDPFDNYGNADGIQFFTVTASGGTNTVSGCRAWWNTDDGFDAYASDCKMVYENCWSWNNGYIPNTFTSAGNGNGFKIGPSSSSPSTTKRVYKNCVAYKNLSEGFCSNNISGVCEVYNNTAYMNGQRGFSIGYGTVVHTTRNNIGYQNGALNLTYQYGITDHSTFLYNGNANASYNVTDADFVSLSSTGIDGTRQTDGSLPIITFLHLGTGSDLINSGITVGLPFSGSSPDLGAFETTVGGSTGNQSPVISNQTFQLNENSTNGTTVGTIIASDPDAGQSLTYSILSGNTSGAFAVNTSTGQLSVANSSVLIYNTNPSFSLIVKVQDNGNPALSSQATITINLLPAAGNNPPVINNQSFTVSKYASNGTTVGTVIATDPNAGQSLTYAITAGNSYTAFSINSTTGVIKVNNKRAFRYKTVYPLTVKVTDNGSPSLSSSATVTITAQ